MYGGIGGSQGIQEELKFGLSPKISSDLTEAVPVCLLAREIPSTT